MEEKLNAVINDVVHTMQKVDTVDRYKNLASSPTSTHHHQPHPHNSSTSSLITSPNSPNYLSSTQEKRKRDSISRFADKNYTIIIKKRLTSFKKYLPILSCHVSYFSLLNSVTAALITVTEAVGDSAHLGNCQRKCSSPDPHHSRNCCK